MRLRTPFLFYSLKKFHEFCVYVFKVISLYAFLCLQNICTYMKISNRANWKKKHQDLKRYQIQSKKLMNWRSPFWATVFIDPFALLTKHTKSPQTVPMAQDNQKRLSAISANDVAQNFHTQLRNTVFLKTISSILEFLILTIRHCTVLVRTIHPPSGQDSCLLETFGSPTILEVMFKDWRFREFPSREFCSWIALIWVPFFDSGV